MTDTPSDNAGLFQGLFSGVRFALSLGKAFRSPWTYDKASEYMRLGIENRAENFLALCDLKIFSDKANVYRKLFDSAGYTRENLVSDIRRHGLETTLKEIAARGVYLDIDEFKGRKPVIRPGLHLKVDASEFDVIRGPSISLKSSGSRGPGMKTRIGVDGLRLFASNIPLMLKFLNAEGLPVMLYYPMPSVSGIVHMILYTLAGNPPAVWFSQTPLAPLWKSINGLKLIAIQAYARFLGVSLPRPEFADINHPVAMAEWIKKNCPDGAVIPTFTGSAIHLIQSAKKERIRLPRCYFVLGGEPITVKKRQIIEDNGHRVFPWYSCVETGRISMGCLSKMHSDEMHLLEDRMAAIINPRNIASTGSSSRPALMLTSIHPDMYKFFLNVETGDEVMIENSKCGCPWESIGLFKHLHSVRSFEKLTLEGMSMIADIFVRFVETDLPEQCGGSPVDYQFSEEEGRDGVTCLVLSASPEVPMETERIKEVFMDLLVNMPNTTFAANLLKQADVIKVRGEFPALTRSGKILTLRSVRKGKSA